MCNQITNKNNNNSDKIISTFSLLLHLHPPSLPLGLTLTPLRCRYMTELEIAFIERKGLLKLNESYVCPVTLVALQTPFAKQVNNGERLVVLEASRSPQLALQEAIFAGFLVFSLTILIYCFKILMYCEKQHINPATYMLCCPHSPICQLHMS